MNLVRYMYLSQLGHSLHIFATIAPPGGVHIFACSCSFRKFAPKACYFRILPPYGPHEALTPLTGWRLSLSAEGEA